MRECRGKSGQILDGSRYDNISLQGASLGYFLANDTTLLAGRFFEDKEMDEGSPASPSLFSILLSLGFSMAIGVFFGYYPANKAAKMDPIGSCTTKVIHLWKPSGSHSQALPSRYGSSCIIHQKYKFKINGYVAAAVLTR